MKLIKYIKTISLMVLILLSKFVLAQDHIPLQIIIEQDGTEKLADKETAAMTKRLTDALVESDFPILVSKNIVKNILTIKLNPSQFSNFYRFSELRDWKIYNVPNTQFILIATSKLVNKYNLHNFMNLKDDVSFIFKNPQEGMDWILQEVGKNYKFKFKTRPEKGDLDLLFNETNNLNDKAPYWNIIVVGHGGSKSIIGLPIIDAQKVLSFFDKNIKTRVVFFESCFIGGKTNILQYKPGTELLRELNYILIIGGVEDSVTYYIEHKIYEAYENFFEYAQDIDKGTKLNLLMGTLNYFLLSPGGKSNIHGTAKIPQVWLPGGLGFQTFNINDNVISLGKVFVKKYEEENKKPIEIREKFAVLIYTFVIFPTLDIYIKDINHPITGFLTKFKVLTNDNRELLYPKFISMTRHDHYIENIVVHPGRYSTNGVLKFIRDAFFDIENTKLNKVFLIGKITGNNDISALIKGVASQELEESLSKYPSDKPITLEKVNIVINSTSRPDDFKIIISFFFNNKYWQVKLNKNNTAWNFQPHDMQGTDFDKWIEEIKKEKSQSISEVLKKKIEQEKIPAAKKIVIREK